MTPKEFDHIYRKNFPGLFRLAFTMLHNEEDSRDLVNDVFANLLDNPPAGAIANIDGYLYRTVRNRALDIIDHHKVIDRFRHLYPIEMKMNEGYDYEHDRLLRRVLDFLDSALTPSAREAMRLIFEQGKSYKETASQLGVSTAMINKHVVKSLRLLREKFTKKESEI